MQSQIAQPIAARGGVARDWRAWKAATFCRRTRWGRHCPASTIPRPTSSSSCRSFIRRARRNPPRQKSHASRSSPRVTAATRSARADSTRSRSSIHGYGKPMTSNISRKFHFQYEITEPVDKGASGHRRDELGRRQFSPELGPPDPRLHWTDRNGGQRTADSPLLDTRREPNPINGVRRNGNDAPWLLELPDELLHRLGRPGSATGLTGKPRPADERRQLEHGPGDRHVQVYSRSTSGRGKPRLGNRHRRAAGPAQLFRSPEPERSAVQLEWWSPRIPDAAESAVLSTGTELSFRASNL